MRACKVDANQVAIVAALRAAGASVIHLHQLGGGIPDILISTGTGQVTVGRLGFLEIKDGDKPPSARKLTKDQIEWWDANQGIGPMAIVTNVDEALEFLAKLREVTHRESL